MTTLNNTVASATPVAPVAPAEVPLTALEIKRAEMKAKVAAQIQAKRDEAEMKLLDNEAFQNALVAQGIRQNTMDTLSSLDGQCEAIVSNMEIYSKSLRKARTWNPGKRYGYGNSIAELLGLLSGIQYSVQEHAHQMLAVTGLTSDLIERTLVAAGNTSYYSVNNGVVVEGTRMKVAEFLECLQLLEYQLGIELDKTLVTQAVTDRLFEVAQVKAEGKEAEARTALSMADMIVR